jgi:hypothetical protein
MFASVSGEITLPVTVNVEAPNGLNPVDALLPNARIDALPAPFDFFGKTDVYGNELGHPFLVNDSAAKSWPEREDSLVASVAATPGTQGVPDSR